MSFFLQNEPMSGILRRLTEPDGRARPKHILRKIVVVPTLDGVQSRTTAQTSFEGIDKFLRPTS